MPTGASTFEALRGMDVVRNQVIPLVEGEIALFLSIIN